MAPVTPTRRSSTTAQRPLQKVVERFRQFVTVKDQGAVLKERQDELRLELLEACEQMGEKDDKGNKFLYLPEPVAFTDHNGKTFKFSVLKRERHLKPAVPQPDPELAEELLRKKGLWLTEKQEKLLNTLRIQCPYATISIEVDPDAVARAYYLKQISEKEYNALLPEQKPEYQFRPLEM